MVNYKNNIFKHLLLIIFIIMTVQRVYAKSENNKKIIIFDANLHSLRCRQRSRMMNGSRVCPLKFASYRETLLFQKKDNCEVIGPFSYDCISRL